MAKLPLTNFTHLAQCDEQLLRMGLLAEKYFAEAPSTCLLMLRQLSEVLAQLVAARTGQLVAPEETQYDLLHRLQGSRILPREVAQLFGEIRHPNNEA
jgi:type I restriction enzyme R subunit